MILENTQLLDKWKDTDFPEPGGGDILLNSQMLEAFLTSERKGGHYHKVQLKLS